MNDYVKTDTEFLVEIQKDLKSINEFINTNDGGDVVDKIRELEDIGYALDMFYSELSSIYNYDPIKLNELKIEIFGLRDDVDRNLNTLTQRLYENSIVKDSFLEKSIETLRIQYNKAMVKLGEVLYTENIDESINEKITEVYSLLDNATTTTVNIDNYVLNSNSPQEYMKTDEFQENQKTKGGLMLMKDSLKRMQSEVGLLKEVKTIDKNERSKANQQER